MSEQETNSPEMNEEGEDRVKNLQSEFNRKLENQEKQFTAMSEALSNINNMLASSQAASQSASSPSVSSGFNSSELESLQYSDPAKYASIIKEQAKKEALQEFQSFQAEQNKRVQATQAKQNAIIAEITREFPEATQAGHPLYDKVQEMYKTLSPEQQNDSGQWENLVYKAAFEVGVKPRSKRSKDDPNDGFVVSGGSGTFPKSGQSSKSQTHITQRMKEFAALLGRPVEDEKYMKSLEKAAARKSWSTYK